MTELRKIRAELRFTQTQMAEALGMSLRGYQDAEPEPRRIHILAAKWVQHCIAQAVGAVG